jgi:hypothetical protein
VRVSFDKIEQSPSSEFRVRITITEYPEWPSKLFGKKPATLIYDGSCTVWHELPSARRPGVFRESLLCEFEERARIGGYHPRQGS